MATIDLAESEKVLSDLGPVLDLDSHEQVPFHLYDQVFGSEMTESIRPIVDILIERSARHDQGASKMLLGDTNPISPSLVWVSKGPSAPGAMDIGRRCEVLDAMAIDAQLMFPTSAIVGMILALHASGPDILRFTPPKGFDCMEAGVEMIAGWNRWVSSTAVPALGRRVRPVSVLVQDTVEAILAEARKMIDGKTGAIWLPSGRPPGGTSPADPALDELWGMCAAADTPVVLHVGTENEALADGWRANVPEFVFGGQDAVEFPVEPFRASLLNVPCETFLTAMVMGGVFERHPTLRFGVIELGAEWFGPFSERLDLWGEQFKKRLAGTLSMKPSAYLSRNVRVTPYVFEPVDTYFERFPGVADCFCFSTDYPHIEGGKYSKQVFFDRLRPLGEDVLRKYFVENGKLILPQ